MIFTGLLFTAAFLGHALILSELIMAETSRDLFASRLGMLAATLGSSVGLGNIWKFPALTGEHGGASFLLVYILSTLVVRLPQGTWYFSLWHKR